MPDDDRERIAANARLTVEKLNELTDFDFGLDRQSVAWLDGYIERMRGQSDAGALTSVLGSYLGECIAVATGGHWAHTEHGWGVDLPNDTGIVFPFAKVAKQFDNGPEDSILSFYDIAVDYLATGKLARRDT